MIDLDKSTVILGKPIYRPMGFWGIELVVFTWAMGFWGIELVVFTWLMG